MSLRELYVARPDQLHMHNSQEAYKETASELHYDVLGVAPEEQLMAFKEDPGTLANKRWRPIEWVRASLRLARFAFPLAQLNPGVRRSWRCLSYL